MNNTTHTRNKTVFGFWGPLQARLFLVLRAAALVARLVDARQKDLVPEELLAIVQKVTTLLA